MTDQRIQSGTAGVIVTAIFLLTLTGCGYHFKGTGLTAPDGVDTIAVTMLENRTSESGIEAIFTGDLTYEFTRSKVLRVVSKDEADAVLGGRIVSITMNTVSHTATYQSDERRVIVKLDLSMKRADGKVIWSDRGLSDREVFKVSDKVSTESNERAAIKVISKRLARKVHDRIFHGF